MQTIEEYEIKSYDKNAVRAFSKSIGDAIRKSVSPDYYVTMIREKKNGLFYCTLIIFLRTEQCEDVLYSVLLFYARQHGVAVTFINSKNRGS